MKNYTVELRADYNKNNSPQFAGWIYITKPNGRSEAWTYYPQEENFENKIGPEDCDKPYTTKPDQIKITKFQYDRLIEIIEESYANPYFHFAAWKNSFEWASDVMSYWNNDTHIEIKPEILLTVPVREQLSYLSREQIQEKLKALEDCEAPEPKRIGAMCYSRSAPPTIVEYVCPMCGEKTLYSRKFLSIINKEVRSCRHLIAILKNNFGFSSILDESTCCAHCSPLTQEPLLKLIVNQEDGSSYIIAPITYDDLNMMCLFLAGRLSYEPTWSKISYPLKPKLPHLRKLFGVSDKVDE